MADIEIDLLDSLITDWQVECPALDASSMAIIGRILRLGSRFEYEANQTLKKFNLNYTDFDVIATLRRSGPPYSLTPTELCDAVLLTSGAMTTALDRLVVKGLIERVNGTKDRRVKSAQLTHEGIELAEKAAKERFQRADRELTPLTLEEKSQLTKLLKKLMTD